MTPSRFIVKYTSPKKIKNNIWGWLHIICEKKKSVWQKDWYDMGSNPIIARCLIMCQFFKSVAECFYYVIYIIQ